MAMTKQSMAAKIIANVDALAHIQSSNPAELAAYRTQLMEAMCQGIIDEINTNAEVAVSVTSVSGVTVGAGVSGPGTGTGTIT
ncbi:MAG: hypothetical protein OEZ10_11470 [Gammaproteobacteria bacterium]|nr:hypothetical protein [Gammaproteobacteria bacterium]